MRSRSGLTLCSILLPVALLYSATTVAGPQFSGWSPSASTGLAGGCPIESRDGNRLFVAGPFDGTLDVFYYQRNGRANDFGPRTKAADPVSRDDANDFCPTPLPGNALLFVSNRPGGCGGTDIYISRYSPGQETWSEPRNLGCAADNEGPNTAGNELSPSVVETAAGTLLYFSTGPGIGGPGSGQDIYESRMRVDGSFGEGVPVDELNTADTDRQPNVSRSGLEIVFASHRQRDSGESTGDIWYASRSSVFQPWSTPVNLSDTVPFGTAAADESRPSFSWDGKRLYYGSGGVYVSTRKPAGGPR